MAMPMKPTGNAVACCPIASPAMIFVAWPVSRSEEHTSELHHVSISYAVFCLKKKKRPSGTCFHRDVTSVHHRLPRHLCVAATYCRDSARVCYVIGNLHVYRRDVWFLLHDVQLS